MICIISSRGVTVQVSHGSVFWFWTKTETKEIETSTFFPPLIIRLQLGRQVGGHSFFEEITELYYCLYFEAGTEQ